MLNKIASLFFGLAIAIVAFSPNYVEAAQKVEVDYITAVIIDKPEIKETESSTTIKTRAIVDGKKVLIVEKITNYTVEGSGVWVAGFRVAGGHQKEIGSHHFRIVDMETSLITYVRSWQVDEKGKIKTTSKLIPKVTYVENE